MLILGLTGSVAMGKSTVATMLAEAGLPVSDADKTVHRLYAGAAAPAIEHAFPGTTVDGVVDRARLREQVVGDSAAMARLEAVIHPLVGAAREAFLAAARAAGHRAVVLDIPLLFETGVDRETDAVIVVTTTPENQMARILEREGMTRERAEALIARQLPDAEKQRRAHFVIETGGTFDDTRRQVADVLRAIAARAAAG